MKRVCVVCEGQTEESFVRDLLAPSFYELGLNLIPEMIATSTGHRGGGLSYERVKRHLRNRLRQQSAPVVTTMFDLYQLNRSFPGFEAAASLSNLSQRLERLKEALHADLVAVSGCRPEQFIPYFQPYEFEALLFSDVATLVKVEPGWQTASAALRATLAAVASPEHINGKLETKPAAHLERELKQPSYRKR